MKKTAALIISSMLVLSSLFVMLDMTAEGKDIAPIPLFSGAGSGTVADPYQITDVDELQEMNLDLNAHYILMNDIDASLTSGWNSDKGFEPIANLTGYFNGTLDGMDFIIHDLTVNRSSQDYAGLFGYLNQSAVISNLGLENVNITGAGFVGGLAGWSDGTIMDSHSAGNVTGGVDSGGFTGASTGPITNCYSTGTLTGTGDSVGGFVGYNAAPITNTYSTVNVTTIGITAGGFAGSNSHTATNCYSTGNVIGTSEVGGFAGLINGGTTINCYSTGNVDGTVKAGGFAGWINAGTAKSSYSTGTVAGIIYVGGFNGITDAGGTITNCYSTGNVIGTSDYIGGFIGNNWQGTISNCHSTGSATTPWHALGGFTGGNEAPSIITDSYATGNAIITGAGWEVGGFSGQNHGSIERCYSLGDATTAGGGIAGGFVGNNYNIITDCFALGNADASSDRVGGFAGYNSDGDTITSCYSIGTASGGIPGGFVGENGVGSTISISHWDITTSGTGSGVNINSGVADVTGHTTIAMKQIATYPGWDFATVWGIVEDNTYAFLTTIDPIVINEQITQIGMATEDIGYSTDFNSTAQPIPFYNKLESWAMN
ncbi:MAG: hypothetical protein KAS16_00045, partial [Thermoplasmata archaeon]|nr:hypothetical protein [Thermoplasmata archaeon]